MISWPVKTPEDRGKWVLPGVVRDSGGAARWNPILQWGIGGLVGLLLGIYAVLVWSLPPQWALLSVPVVLALLVAMSFRQVRKTLLAIILLDIPLQVDKYFAYRASRIGGAIPGLVVSVTTLSLAILYALWLAELLAKPRETGSRPQFRPVVPLAIYVALAILSVIVAQDMQLAIFGVFLLGQMLLLYVYIVGTVRTRDDLLFVVTMLLVGLALEGLIMITLGVVGHSIEVGGVLNARVDKGPRVGGTVGGPNTASGYLTLLLAPALGAALASSQWRSRVLATTAFGLGVVALILTRSRAGWLAWAVSMVAFWLPIWRPGRLPTANLSAAGDEAQSASRHSVGAGAPSRPLALPPRSGLGGGRANRVLPVLLVIAGVLFAILFGDEIVGRLFGDDDGSAAVRIPLMIIAWRAIMANPLLGVGINNFTVVMLQYANMEHAGTTWLYAVHNQYLLVWAEIGTLGFLAFVWFLLATVRRGWQCWKFGDRQLSLLVLGFTAAVVGHAIQLNFDTFQNRASVQMLWVSAALIAVMHSLGRTKMPNDRNIP